ncbi:MAG: hypothetical protein RLZZ283_484 [Candidatus Parcubacteria bacterium]|jgi:aspartokinase
MRSIPQAVRDTIESDGFLHFGLSNRVLNLSKTAKFIRPLIEARTKKSASVPSILMALSRLRVKKHRTNVALKAIKLDAITMHKGLVELTYEKTVATARAVEKISETFRREGAYVVTTFGTTEITVITESALRDRVERATPKPKAVVANLAAVAVQFNERYIVQTGMVYTLIQQLTFQNINVIEFSSTYTELVFYLAQKDMKIAFDTLYEQFM